MAESRSGPRAVELARWVGKMGYVGKLRIGKELDRLGEGTGFWPKPARKTENLFQFSNLLQICKPN
jgi:hypothetical protein